MELWETCVFEDGRKCTILTKKACGNCRFEKSKEEYEASKKKAEERIKNLPEKIQARIKESYRIVEPSPVLKGAESK